MATVSMTRTQTITNVPMVNTIATSFHVVVASIRHPTLQSRDCGTRYSSVDYGNKEKSYNLGLNFPATRPIARPAHRPHHPRRQWFALFQRAAARGIFDADGERRPSWLLRSCSVVRRFAVEDWASYLPSGIL